MLIGQFNVNFTLIPFNLFSETGLSEVKILKHIHSGVDREFPSIYSVKQV